MSIDCMLTDIKNYEAPEDCKLYFALKFLFKITCLKLNSSSIFNWNKVHK